MEICCSTFSKWDSWLLEQSNVSFAQSMMWGRLLAEEEKDVELLQAVEDGKIFSQALVVAVKLPFGFTYLFSPKGPVIAGREADVYGAFFDYFRERHFLFWRVEPAENKIPNIKYQIKKISDVNPRATTILDIEKTPEEILNGMRQKTRYNIRLAEKKGVTAREEKNWDIFWRLLRITGERDGFRLHDKKHYERIFWSPFSRQLTAWADGQPVATGLFVGFGKVFTYLFGASDYNYHRWMAPYLLQWEGIQLAKRLGYSRYDFFGIAPRCRFGEEDNGYCYDAKHQYAGVTRFKLGFGGGTREALGTFDLIISPWRYKLYQVLRKMRRWF